MKTNKPTTEFWTVLTMVNVLALMYPIQLLLRANSVDENLFATCVLVGSLFLLVVVDAVSIVVAEAVGTGKRWRGLRVSSANHYLPVESVCNKRIDLTDTSEKIGHRDALYLCACHLEWRAKRNLTAYQEFIAALDDQEGDIRCLAEGLLHRSSPRPERTATFVQSW